MKVEPYLRFAQFYETDAMGIIYHANYIHWMEEARIHLMDQLGWPYARVHAAGLDFGVTEVHCLHRGMVRFGDTVSIALTIPRLTPAKMEVGYRITDAATGALRAEGSTGHFFYDMREGKPVALKRVLPELYARFAQYKEEST